jgi:hypothetical protein
VAAGRLTDAWILALAGWFLIHGQACFLLFVPVLTLAVLAALCWPRRRRLPAAARSFRPGPGTVVAAVAAVAAATTLAVIPGTRTSTNDIDESLPRVVATIAARAPGRPIVLHLDHPTWPEVAGFLVQADRTGVQACIDDPWYTFIVTRQFICTPAQASAGKAYWFYAPKVPAGARVLARLHGVAVAALPS